MDKFSVTPDHSGKRMCGKSIEFKQKSNFTLEHNTDGPPIRKMDDGNKS